MHRAKWLVSDHARIYENGYLIEIGGQILDVGSGNCTFSGEVVDHGDGILFPGFVNPHTHFELSALEGRVSSEQGFLDWVKALVELRSQLSEPELIASAKQAIIKAYTSGTVLFGDISSLGISQEMSENAPGRGVWFYELLGQETSPHPIFIPDSHHQQSIAAHAPHTTSPELIRQAYAHALARLMPFSMHVAESDDEQKCVTRQSGVFSDWMMTRGIDISCWGFPARSSVAHLDRLGVLGENTIAVHAIHADKSDIELLSSTGTHVCICPRSNVSLHGKLPDVPGMVEKGVRVSIGTDSLASTKTLDIRDEIRFTSDKFPGLSPELLFKMATQHGADALGLYTQVGVLAPGARLPMGYAATSVSEKSRVIPTLLFDMPALKMVAGA